ncbi:MAG TPA: hypothetical protein VKS01_02420 [Bryobacteraceae bacterium]|nr:hypothetical protein [Bryobacteraceae bacterium]
MRSRTEPSCGFGACWYIARFELNREARTECIGIQSGLKGETYFIDSKTVAMAASINSRIVITIYGANVHHVEKAR